MERSYEKRRIPRIIGKTAVHQKWLVFNLALLVVYIYVIAFWFEISNPYLFAALMFGQLFYFFQGVSFIAAVWNTETKRKFDENFAPRVDVFITVAGEPVSLVRDTALAARNMDYPNFQVTILNDGYVAKKDNWQEIEEMARDVGVNVITRSKSGGAKAGNINNGLRNTHAPLVAIFDADHVPYSDFLKKTVGFLVDPKVGFVQTPQYYKNHKESFLAGGAWDQQQLFFGPICKGKNRIGAPTMCGTNMVIRREAIEAVGGMCDTNIAEDFVTGMFIHEKGYISVYVPEVLVEGLAPEDFLSYYKQQHRWARGSLEVIFKYNPLFRRGLSWMQKWGYLSSAAYYFSGLVVLINALFPIFFFYTGQIPFAVSTMALAIVFLPYIFVTLYNIERSMDFRYSFRALAFSMASFHIHIIAIFQTIFGSGSTFSVTSKQKLSGNFVKLVIPHIVYIILFIVGSFYALITRGLSPSFVTNVSWALLNISVFIPFILVALPSKEKKHAEIPIRRVFKGVERRSEGAFLPAHKDRSI